MTSVPKLEFVVEILDSMSLTEDPTEINDLASQFSEWCTYDRAVRCVRSAASYRISSILHRLRGEIPEALRNESLFDTIYDTFLQNLRKEQGII